MLLVGGISVQRDLTRAHLLDPVLQGQLAAGGEARLLLTNPIAQQATDPPANRKLGNQAAFGQLDGCTHEADLGGRGKKAETDSW